jgi:L,D-peptidoglycan transpeptidase YkuD (ErfK/YbiS/YcfS/YnhG family)
MYESVYEWVYNFMHNFHASRIGIKYFIGYNGMSAHFRKNIQKLTCLTPLAAIRTRNGVGHTGTHLITKVTQTLGPDSTWMGDHPNDKYARCSKKMYKHLVA